MILLLAINLAIFMLLQSNIQITVFKEKKNIHKQREFL